MMSEKPLFAAGDFVVYPTHGVGKIVGIETQEIAGHTLSVFVVAFDKDRMTLRVPLGKGQGVRVCASFRAARRWTPRSPSCGAARAPSARCGAAERRNTRRRSRPAILASIAEVVRDLYRNAGQPEQSYSERQIYQAALDRFVREFAAVERIDETTATAAGRADADGVKGRRLQQGDSGPE